MESEETNLLELEDKVKLQVEKSCSQENVNIRQRKIFPKEINPKIEELKYQIKKNLLGCDLTICIFIAALKSYKADGCLRPFPHYFLTATNEKDFISLKEACDKIPPLKDFLTLPANNIPNDVINLLTWLFFESGFPVLTPYPLKELPVSINKDDNSNSTIPQFVFKVNFTKRLDESWRKKVAEKDVFYAFHGSSISNFYSILRFGLQTHFSVSKEVLFGMGIYLSDEISVSTNYAPFGETWKNSILGSKHSIIAVSGIINDQEEVKCRDKANKERSMNQNSFDEIPEKYFVVKNSELVRVEYILVYRSRAPSAVKSFIKANFLWIVIILYFLLLVFIGFRNGPYYRKLFK
ncbi:protein mono-ADP-ribosyltransferase PARP16-like [Rhynchophorus ferrugineus]|uniref:protein mono-ADP-ribosyltransferase PARP16-like n=1 Tax=Rhynchophorus ferrugineus TaxID=354439 RepID=UPI003FCD7D62